MGSPPHCCPRSERGTALIGVLLLLMLMSALASALAVSSRTDTLLSRNHLSAAQARAAAEAGLNHAVESVITWITQWKVRDDPDVQNVQTAINALLTGIDADPDFLAGITFGDAGDPTAITGASNAEYHVFLTDDDGLRNDENDDPLVDTNRVVVIQAVGYAGRELRGANIATARLEAIIAPLKLPALVADGDLNIAGGAAMNINVSDEATGGVHVNGDLVFSGKMAINGTPDELGTATATGDCADCQDPDIVSGTDGSGGNAAPLEIPTITTTDYEDWADYIFQNNGNIFNPATGMTVASCAKACLGTGWSYQAKSREWTLTSTTGQYSSGTFYVDGPVTISAGTAKNPAVATIIATGTINATGGNIVPAAGDLLFVTDKDLTLSGNFTAGTPPPKGREGQILVREQIATSGNVTIYGQIVVANCAVGKPPDCTTVSTGTPHTNTVGGSVTITNTKNVGTSTFRVSGWREVR